jgi:hypothetical protein
MPNEAMPQNDKFDGAGTDSGFSALATAEKRKTHHMAYQSESRSVGG